MKRLFIILNLAFAVSNLQAQKNTGSLLDSMQHVLSISKTDSTTCNRLLRWVSDLVTAEHETAVLVSKWAIKAAKKNGNKKCLAQAWYSLGRSYLVIDDYKSAMVYFKTASQLAEKYNFYALQGKLYSAFANTYSAVKQYATAREYYYKAINISKERGFKDDLPGFYYNLASLEYESKPDSNYVKNSLTNINNAISSSNYKSNYDVLIYSYWLKALIYSQKLKSDSAAIFIDKAFSISKEFNYTDFAQVYYSYKGMFYKNKRKYNEAVSVIKQGLLEAQKSHSQLWIYNLYGELANVYALMGDYKNAYNLQHMHKMYYDSVVNTENFAKLNEVETQLKIEKKDKQVLKATKEKQIAKLQFQKSDQEKQNLLVLTVSIGVIVLILAVLLFILIRNIRSRKEAYIKLQQKNIEIQTQGEQLIKLSSEITRYQTQMNPHFVFNALNSIQGFVVNNEKEKTLQQLGNFSKLMRTTLNHSNHELIEIENEIEFLKTYIAFEMERFNNCIQFNVDVKVDKTETMIPPMLIQPLLENALKHARLGDVANAEISLKIYQEGNLVKILVEDNGKGIVGGTSGIINQSHAMSIIQSRIKLVFKSEKIDLPNEFFKVISTPEIMSGTRVEFYLPFITKF